MNGQELHYCEGCSKDILRRWKGWPHKDPIPFLPRIESGLCSLCGGSRELSIARVAWSNVHGQFSTGLPDYWLLAVDVEESRWGRPYYAEGNCPKCRARSVISEMNYPNGSHEMKHNCGICGVVAPQRGK